jgi:hypothetical protein
MDNKGLKMAPASTVTTKKASPAKTSKSASVVGVDEPTIRPFANTNRKLKKNPFNSLRSSAGVVIAFGLLITALGVMSYIPYHNTPSKLMLDLGLITTFVGYITKCLDILIRIVVER